MPVFLLCKIHLFGQNLLQDQDRFLHIAIFTRLRALQKLWTFFSLNICTSDWLLPFLPAGPKCKPDPRTNVSISTPPPLPYFRDVCLSISITPTHVCLLFGDTFRFPLWQCLWALMSHLNLMSHLKVMTKSISYGRCWIYIGLANARLCREFYLSSPLMLLGTLNMEYVTSYIFWKV